MLATLLLSLPLFALIACGYLAGRLRMMPDAGVSGLNAFVFYFALPALLFRVLALGNAEEILDVSFLSAWLTAGLVVFGTVGLAAAVLFRAPLGEAALLALGAEFSNSGYLGIPLVVNLLGEGAAVPIALTIVVDLVLLLPLTMVLAELSTRRAGGAAGTLVTVARGALLNPLVIAIVLGIAVAWQRWSLPAPLDTFTQTLGVAAGPSALFAIGATLANRPVARGLGEISLMVVGKLLLHPVLVLVAVVFLYDVNPFFALAAMLNAAIPPATNVFVLAERYGLRAERISTGILVATVLAMATFSLTVRLYGFR